MDRAHLLRDVVAVGLLAAAVLVAVALASHSPLDPSPFHLASTRQQPTNLVGWLGATLSAGLLGLVGLAALALPPAAAILGWRLLRHHDLERPRAVIAGSVLCLIAVPAVAHVIAPEIVVRQGVVPCGGVVGRVTAELLADFAGPVGRVVVLVFLGIIGLLLVTGGSAATVAEGLQAKLAAWLAAWRQRRLERRRERERERDRQKVFSRQLSRMETSDDYRGSITIKEVEGRGRFRVVRRPVEAPVAAADEPDDADEPAPPRRAVRVPAPAPVVVEPAEVAVDPAPERPRPRPPQRPRPEPPPAPVIQEEFEFVEDLQSYDVPRPSFLEAPDPPIERDSSALLGISELITQKCHEFRVGGEVVNIRTGPVITTYEYRLDSGVKIAAMQNLAEDLALALKAEAVRIERIHGRATVGIEVPSPDPEVIRLRTLLESHEFKSATSLLTLSMGVDIRGKPFFADLQRMPHLLIGGFTGSGKSVGINAMIMSILYKARPDEVRFIFVDPKMVELGVYSDIPHLLTPIITDPKKATNALAWACDEMDKRYQQLATLGVRNLEQFNQLVGDKSHLRRALEQRFGDDAEAAAAEYPPLPYIVIIIDEMADLMMTSGRAVEESITRLAQKARAVGVHLICATQRPSVDILTGIIKANFPCRAAYKVRSKFDSRTILDVMGAEHLLGRGDMLFLPPGSSTLIRLHGPLVTEKEIATTVRYVKRFGKPDYLREILTHRPPSDDKGRGGRRSAEPDDEDELTDPMYEQAARLVVATRKASASYVQRRLHLGYTRSARLLDMMEREGLVGPLAGSKGREVLVPENYFGEVDETLALSPDDGDDD